MAVVSSGAISLSAIQTEFGGSNPISMSEYYRGGSYTTSNNTGVPTSGAISISQFYSTTAADYVPNAVDWSNIYSFTSDDSGENSAQNSNQTISGINQTITLSLVTTDGYAIVTGSSSPSTTITISVFKNGSYLTDLSFSNISSGASAGTHSSSVNFNVVSGDTIKFEAAVVVISGFDTASGEGGGTFSVKNVSSGNATLDTFTIGIGATTSGDI